MKPSAFEIVLEIVGVTFIACAVMAAISLMTYDPVDPSINSYLTNMQAVHNKAGIIGAGIADTLVQSFGASAWILTLGSLYLGVTLCFKPMVGGMSIFTAGLALMVAMVSAGLGLRGPVDPLFSNIASGGAMGTILSGVLLKWFSVYGSWVIVVTICVMAFMIITQISFAAFTFRLLGAGVKIKESGVAGGGVAWQWLARTFERLRRWFFRLPENLGQDQEPAVEIFDEHSMAALAMENGQVEEEEPPCEVPLDEEHNDLLIVDPQLVDEDNFPDQAPPLPPPSAPRQKRKPAGKAEEFLQGTFGFKGDGVEYGFPALSLLDATQNTIVKQTREELVKRTMILERKLLDFGIEGRVTQVLPGPVITVYEFEPAPGIKVSRIANLADDLAMSLRAMSVRVLAPIPGKSVVGIEAPNPSREMVFLKELLASEEFERAPSKLTMALGKDVAGRPAMADLASVPHLLIAGSTGSGKSVGINAMICSILYKASPEEVKFIMIDPKMLELSIYEGIPHLIAPVVTNPKKASNALRWAVEEMERRYEKLSNLGVRNINGYNMRVEKELARRKSRGLDPHDDSLGAEPLEKLPYIVVVIDELADLMMVSSKDVEDSLARLAQMARAAGIHLIVATQRPSVDVLTGLIKANFPARISYQVRTRVDSRTILDSMGADTLLGKGDMLYLPAGASKLVRIHGPFVSDEEIHRVVDYLKDQRKPEYDAQILEAREGDSVGDGGDGGFGAEDMDENYDKAVELVARTRQASISMIQRRLRIGYNRAARIVEMMESQGLVGPADGLKPREVFIKELDDVESVN